MADPAKYFPTYSFSGFQANSPSTPLPAPRVDDELNKISQSIDGVVDSILDIRRADGALKNGIVTIESLSAGIMDDITAAVQGPADTATAAALAAQGFRNEAEGFKDTAQSAASTATAQAGAAAGSAATAAERADAVAAVLKGTSTSVNTVGTGTKNFIAQAGKGWQVGQRVRAATDDTAETMDGEVLSYDIATGALSIAVDEITGAGAHSDWNISVVGNRGYDAWYPIFAVVSDGDRRVHRIVDWTNGTGTKPPIGKYLGAVGYVDTAAEAVNIRGDVGLSGAGTGDMLASNNLGDLDNVTTARENLGLVVGSDVQAYNANLAAEAGLTGSADQVSYYTGAGAKALFTFNSFARALGTLADWAAFRTAAGLVIGTNVQAQSANLAAEAGLTGSADQVSYYTGAGTKALATLNALGRSIVGAANAAAVRAAIGLVIGTDVQAYDADTVKSDVTANLTVGFTTTEFDAGTKSSGTFTPAPASGNQQKATNGGAHTLAPPANPTSMVIRYVNGASAGAITRSGFTKVTGDTPTTTNGHEFFFYIVTGGGKSHLHIQALQ